MRLKGGDPYLFGRGGEEALALRERGLAVEVVPGVTSAVAAPELAGIPVTHRGVTSSLTIVTGHEEPGKDSPLDWNVLARLGGTLVVLMGVSRLEQNVAALIQGGRSPQTPAAVVEKGGYADQRLIVGTLQDITERARRAEIRPPSILVVGDVVRLAQQLSPKRIAILRPAAQAEESARLAEAYGFLPFLAPAIALAEKPMPSDLMARVADAECVAFTSANGVEMALKNEALRASLAGKLVVAIGPKTQSGTGKAWASGGDAGGVQLRWIGKHAARPMQERSFPAQRPRQPVSVRGLEGSRSRGGRHPPLRGCGVRGSAAG